MAKEAKAVDDARQSVGTAPHPEARPGELPSGEVPEDAHEMEARGRMLTEYGALRRRLSELMAETSRVGAEFQELSNQLRMCPNVVAIDGLILPNSNKAPFARSLFDTRSLVDLVGQIRETIARKNEIQERLQELGILDAYGQFRY